uniref:Uncharacterized protein n=1 Tax=Myoviridae sp. ctJ2i1 TaxID=2825079 RepID=A0A8S5V1Y9_9CAUD|nr:MAG TPA: hypothetical protein [Myoviridae sp. ctJ2i1]
MENRRRFCICYFILSRSQIRIWIFKCIVFYRREI